MGWNDIINGMIIGILLIKLIEYKLKRNKTYQNMVYKLGKIKNTVFSGNNDNKDN